MSLLKISGEFARTELDGRAILSEVVAQLMASVHHPLDQLVPALDPLGDQKESRAGFMPLQLR